MPVQRTLLGQPLALRMPPRRFQLLVVFVVLFIATVYAFGAPSADSIPTYEQVKDAVKDPHLPELPALSDIKDHIPKLPTELPELPNLPVPDIFSPPAHKPPDQANSTASSSYGAIRWLADFKWHIGFSQKVTLDENRAVLPPLAIRPPIYTYYEPKSKQDKKATQAENRLILAWRRAWWAQGFKPIVLNHKDAMGPQYEMVQRMKLEPSAELEFFRWLAWAKQGGGILANWLTLPMAQFDNPMISFLRRGEFPKLSRVESLQNGIFFGESAAVDNAIQEAINNKLLQDVPANKDKIAKLALQDGGIVVNLLSADVAVDKKANGLAYYNTDVVNNKYKTVRDKLSNTTHVEGLELLADLINSHLHLVFQETHPDGIAIVKPLPEHTTALTYNAIEIGRNLTQCPSSPMPNSCPPNRQKCKPCNPNKPLPFNLVPTFKNSTKLYSIGVVPHPYTLTLLHYTREDIDENFLIEAERDLWLKALTKELLGPNHSELFRVLFFKEEVASLRKASHSLWLTAERTTQADLEWIFGFNLPQSASPNKEPSSPSKDSELIIFPRPSEPKGTEGVEAEEERWIRKEEERLEKAREVLSQSHKAKKEDTVRAKVKQVEDWNLFDTEAWRFARAFSARRRNERKDWEEQEKRYSGSERKAGVKTGGGRWSDRFK
ncbi:hypothetical protein P171DRAFT_471498 [Karstenula rhodostoma CBS 690.94]|uniref:Uncharacterized protein n=1 Tax=Karstenula rhodostoma CBS 690.94 TaxID=1392251 RepID=A0A9P4PL59_9PLEO|nr:hypothetical protein P171DRAFT_471498 [Karstenula rhodostoma CBS 690.94]